jgi:hypothetical protein
MGKINKEDFQKIKNKLKEMVWSVCPQKRGRSRRTIVSWIISNN